MKFALLALALFGTCAQAADTVNITVSGTLTRPPCVLSTSTTLTAEFGDVRIDQVAATATQPIPVRLTCPAGSSLTVGFSANNGVYTATVARTTADNLGVSLLWGDDALVPLNGATRTYTNLNGAVDLSLKAQLGARGALAPGAFSSAMVMTINYL